MDDQTGRSSLNIKENTAALLCYLLGWVSGLVIYLLESKSRFVRYHAIQSMVTFGTISVVVFVFRRVPLIGWIVTGAAGAAGFVAWVVGILRAYQGQIVKFPVAGNVAERLVVKG
jgi:uncharacterized membrane protein